MQVAAEQFSTKKVMIFIQKKPFKHNLCPISQVLEPFERTKLIKVESHLKKEIANRFLPLKQVYLGLNFPSNL